MSSFKEYAIAIPVCLAVFYFFIWLGIKTEGMSWKILIITLGTASVLASIQRIRSGKLSSFRERVEKSKNSESNE